MKNISKKYILGFFIIIISLLFSSMSTAIIVNDDEDLNLKQISKSFSFIEPKITTIEIETKNYHRIFLEDCISTGDPGEPKLPVKGVKLLLPSKSSIDTIEIESEEKISLGSNLLIEPQAEFVPMSQMTSAEIPIQNGEIYNSEQLFPGKLYDIIDVCSVRGFDVLILNLYPVQYKPLTGDLFYYPQLTVSIETKEDSTRNELYRGLNFDEQEILSMVDNPNVNIINNYRDKIPTSNPSEEYDLLILTNDSWEPGFEPLIDLHNEQGISTIIVNLTEATQLPLEMHDYIEPSMIRTYIREKYLEWEIKYVLIGGDYDVIPAQQLLFGEVGLPSSKICGPSDLFFECLDGTYNNDGDNYWGEYPHWVGNVWEYGDGPGGGWVDLGAEVYVGRVCADNLSEVENYVHKIIYYMNSDINDDYYKEVVMAGEYLWGYYEEPYIFNWGGNYDDEMVNGCWYTDDSTWDCNDYTTVGIPAGYYNVTRLYDRDWPTMDLQDPWSTGWPGQELVDRINNGVHIINHIGHGNISKTMKISNKNVSEDFTNEKYFFVFSQACFSGSFDNKTCNDPTLGHGDEGFNDNSFKDIDPGSVPFDCLAEYLTVKNKYGAFGVVMNSRFGWGDRYDTDGPSQRYNRFFWHRIFNENDRILSKANFMSKWENNNLVGQDRMLWCYYQQNFFGDPALKLNIYRNGDGNSDGGINVGDAVFIVKYAFNLGPAPDPLCLGDANGDGYVNVGDAVYLINFIFRGGPEPIVTINCLDRGPMCGDLNGDLIVGDYYDLAYLEDYLYNNGPAPVPLCVGDVNADGVVDGYDLFVFYGSGSISSRCCDN